MYLFLRPEAGCYLRIYHRNLFITCFITSRLFYTWDPFASQRFELALKETHYRDMSGSLSLVTLENE